MYSALIFAHMKIDNKIPINWIKFTNFITKVNQMSRFDIKT